MDDLEIMIILIEGEYPSKMRNTPSKLKALLLKEFEYEISEKTIMLVYGLDEDYERESKRIEHGCY